MKRILFLCIICAFIIVSCDNNASGLVIRSSCPTSCTQTDGGDNIYIKGTDTYYVSSWGRCNVKTNTDYCKNATHITEFYNCKQSVTRICPGNCVNGTCTSSCRNYCSSGTRKCISNITYQQCGDWNGDGCTEWGPAVACGDYLMCSSNSCAKIPCNNECTANTTMCLNNSQYRVCGNFDRDICTEWSSIMTHNETSACTTAGIALACANECTQSRTGRCKNSTSYTRCGYFDSDACLDLLQGTCSSPYACSAGYCVFASSGPCSDSDNGNYPFVSGSVITTVNHTGTIISAIGRDACINSTHISELVCTPDGMESIEQPCSTDETAVCNSTNGKCVSQPQPCFTCQSRGYECGTYSSCTGTFTCGTCRTGEKCSSGKCVRSNISVELLVYLPYLEKSGQTLIQNRTWNDPVALAKAFRDDIYNASSGKMNYAITETIVIDGYIPKTGDFIFTDDQYLSCLSNPGQEICGRGIDYQRMLSENQICEKLNSGKIDELWVFGAPFMGMYESAMTGPVGWWINGPHLANTECGFPIVIMGFNYERGVYEMMDSYGHRVESTMANVYGSWDINKSNHDWDRFTHNWKQTSGVPYYGCGSSHYAANSPSDYLFRNKTLVASDCDDWYNFPNLKGEVKNVNCDSWGCEERKRMIYWYSHMPKAEGLKEGIYNNWWKYISLQAISARSQIRAKEDDATSGCTNSVNDQNIYIGIDESCQPNKEYTSGLRFKGVEIPKGAIIDSAKLIVTADGPYTNGLSVLVSAEKSTTSSDFTQSPPSGRQKTAAMASWTMSEPWELNKVIESSDLAKVIQEVVSMPEWNKGGTITLLISFDGGSSHRRFFGFDRDPSKAPKLVINYHLKDLIPVSTWQAKIISKEDDGAIGCQQSYNAYDQNINIGMDNSCSSASPYHDALRFVNVTIPRGATIKSSKLVFTADGPYTNPLEMYVFLDKANNSLPLSVNNSPLNRHWTDAYTTWNIDTKWDFNTEKTSADFASALQDVVNLPGWKSGNSVTVLLIYGSGEGNRRFYAFDRDPTKAAKLVVQYS